MKHNYNVSHTKLKKYAKLNRIIKKCFQFKKQHKHFSKSIPLRKERVDLVNKLNNYQIKLEDSIKIYEIDTQHLQSEIQVLQDSLSSLTNRYVISQNQISEHILAANELVRCQCSCQTVSNHDTVRPVVTEDPSQAVILPQDCIHEHDTSIISHNCLQMVQPELYENHECSYSVMFSDSIGRGVGKLLSNNLSHSVQNHCMPGATYKQIMASVTKIEYNCNTNLTIFVGNSSKIKKGDITNSIIKLLKLNCSKIIMCAFPYFKNLSTKQNQYIHMLNVK